MVAVNICFEVMLNRLKQSNNSREIHILVLLHLPQELLEELMFQIQTWKLKSYSGINVENWSHDNWALTKGQLWSTMEL